MNKLVVILGPTSTGKTSLAIKLCKKFNGEIVSADSRQIYKFMDVGTGKFPSEVRGEKWEVRKGDGMWEMGGVRIHLYDIVEPDKKFSVARYKDVAVKTIEGIWRREKQPFLVGGTGFYIAAVSGEAEFPRIPPNWKLRRELEKLSTEELFEKLKKLDPQRAEAIDSKNPHRLIRAIEIAALAGNSPAHEGKELSSFLSELNSGEFALFSSPAGALKIGLTAPREVLYQRADAWADSVVNNGLITEVKHLINLGYENTSPMQGIIYKTVLEHLDGRISKEEMLERIKFDLHGYIRRQLTWFKREKEIKWFDITEPNFDEAVENLIESFLENG